MLKSRLTGSRTLLTSSIPTKRCSPWTDFQRQRSRSLLRAILRETTYLADPRARIYIAKHVKRRFHHNRYFVASTASRDPADQVVKFAEFETSGPDLATIVRHEWQKRIREGRQAFKTLQKANAAQFDALLKVLHLTYGRIGKRRHLLLAPLKQADSTAGMTGKTAKREPALFNDKLRALYLSQLRVGPPEEVRANPKDVRPDIPKRNAWDQPMPQCRVRNMTKEWYAQALDHLHAPLPDEEWELLRDHALGSVRLRIIGNRRTVARGSQPDDGSDGSHSFLQYILGQDKDCEKVHARPPLRCTSRIMRNAWARVFAQCPKMSWNNDTSSWTIVWGCEILMQQLKNQILVPEKPVLPVEMAKHTPKWPTPMARLLYTRPWEVQTVLKNLTARP